MLKRAIICWTEDLHKHTVGDYFLSDADPILCSSCFSTSYLEVGPSHVIPDDQSFASSDNGL